MFKLFTAIEIAIEIACGFEDYVLNLDLEDFFPSIREARVAARLQYPPFNFTEKMAKTIAGLCAIRIEDEEGKEDFVLPQGAPTSPLLTNAICDSMDYIIAVTQMT